MKVTIFDYGAGNLHSLAKAVAGPRVDVHLETNARLAVTTDVLILPGVGAFGAATDRLAPGREAMRQALEEGLPCLGICLGMQLLLDRSDEGEGAGLGVIAGDVTRLAARRVPHIGWNTLDEVADPIFLEAPLPIAYFANSYVCRPTLSDTVIAWTTHDDDRFPAALRRGNTVGVQFHPEKSSGAGVRFIRAFLDSVRR
jgi:imidazole glycerol-phosphate synthase subunit HisH